MSEKQPKLKFEEEKERTATRSPPKKSKVEQSVPQKQKLKQDADKAAEKAQHLRFGKAEITPDEASRMTKQQKRAMYAAAAARSAVHREIDQYEDDNVGMQALSEGEKAAETAHDISKSRYARKLKKKAKMQGKKGAKTANLPRRSRLRHKMQAHPAPARAAPTGSPDGGRNRTSGRATMPPPIRAQRRRPQAARRYPMAPLLRSPAWSRSSTKEDRWSAPQSTALPILQRATRTFF